MPLKSNNFLKLPSRTYFQHFAYQMQSLVPACSNIYKLIFNNDQALLLLVQNYIQLYNTCADHPNIHQSQKQCQLYEKVRFNSITLSISSLTKSQTEAILHPNVLFYHHSKTTYPSPGYYASFWRVHTIHDPDLLQLLSR